MQLLSEASARIIYSTHTHGCRAGKGGIISLNPNCTPITYDTHLHDLPHCSVLKALVAGDDRLVDVDMALTCRVHIGSVLQLLTGLYPGVYASEL